MRLLSEKHTHWRRSTAHFTSSRCDPYPAERSHLPRGGRLRSPELAASRAVEKGASFRREGSGVSQRVDPSPTVSLRHNRLARRRPGLRQPDAARARGRSGSRAGSSRRGVWGVQYGCPEGDLPVSDTRPDNRRGAPCDIQSSMMTACFELRVIPIAIRNRRGRGARAVGRGTSFGRAWRG
jgi:hypothetical protein